MRVERQIQREDKRGTKDQMAESESSGDEKEEEAKTEGSGQQDWEKKRKKRTKEEIEKEVLLLGDLYAILGIEDLTYEAGEADIK